MLYDPVVLDGGQTCKRTFPYSLYSVGSEYNA
jgi:hypothetical protein